MRRLPIVILVAALALSAVSQAFSDPKAPRIVMVVAPKDFTDQEYADPREIFDHQGAVVRVASTTRGPAVSHNGKALQVDEALSEIRLPDFDALIIVGGTGAITYLMDNEALRTMIVAACKADKVVAAICVAPAVLAHAGVLRNRRATCYPEKRVVSVLKLNGADYVEDAVVASGRVLTANGPDAAKDFAVRVVETLTKG